MALQKHYPHELVVALENLLSIHVAINASRAIFDYYPNSNKINVFHLCSSHPVNFSPYPVKSMSTHIVVGGGVNVVPSGGLSSELTPLPKCIE